MMTKLDLFLSRLRKEFQDYVVVARPYRSPDDETIEHFLHLLCVPEDDLGSATGRALEIAAEIYGEGVFPFYLTAIDPEVSANYFGKDIEESRWLHTPSLIRMRTGTRVHGCAAIGEWTGSTLLAAEATQSWLGNMNQQVAFPRVARHPRDAGSIGNSAYAALNHYSLAS